LKSSDIWLDRIFLKLF